MILEEVRHAVKITRLVYHVGSILCELRVTVTFELCFEFVFEVNSSYDAKLFVKKGKKIVVLLLFGDVIGTLCDAINQLLSVRRFAIIPCSESITSSDELRRNSSSYVECEKRVNNNSR